MDAEPIPTEMTDVTRAGKALLNVGGLTDPLHRIIESYRLGRAVSDRACAEMEPPLLTILGTEGVEATEVHALFEAAGDFGAGKSPKTTDGTWKMLGAMYRRSVAVAGAMSMDDQRKTAP